MNERHLRKLLRGLTLWSAPLSTTLTLACGGATIGEPPPDGNEAGTEQGGSSAGSTTNHGGTGVAGKGVGGAGIAGTGVGGTGVAGSGFGGSFGGVGGAEVAGSFGGGDCRHETAPNCSFATYVVAPGCLPFPTMPNQALPTDTCHIICGQGSFFCSVTETTATTVTVSCPPGCAVGRRPAGFCPSLTLESRALGKYFAQLAELEGASVTAFRVLRDELHAHGAPRRLQRAASRAARDEIRHARATRALARRAGGAAAEVAPARPAPRSLEEIALENAVEGCVRETFGALLATFQAEHATDLVVRAAMERISRDETRHAALSWQVARWLDARLSPAARRRVKQARSQAARELVQGAAKEEAPLFAARIGLPARERAAVLATQLAAALW